MSDTVTRLIIQGDDNDIENFILNVKGDTNLDFYKILPIPFDLKYTIHPIKIMTEESYQNAWHHWLSKKKLGLDNEKLPRLGMTRNQYDYLMEKYGYSNWCEWSIAMFGTKKGPYDVGEWEISEEQAVIEYTTLWAPATNFYIHVSKLYPNLIFRHEYVDDQDIYIGDETIIDGEIVDSNDLIYNSYRAILLKQSFRLK